MNLRARVLLTGLLAISFLTGCWDRRELEERISIVAFSVDKNEKDPSLVDVTIQVPIPIKIVGAGGGGSAEGGMKAVTIMSSSGHTVLDAMQNIQNRLNQQLFFGHTRIVVVSDQLAKSDLTDFIDQLRRSPQVRRLLWPVVVPGRASRLLQVDPKLEQIPVMFVKELLETGSNTKRIPDITLGQFFVSLSDTSIEPVVNMVAPTDHGMKWLGVAVFHGSKMVGQLNDQQVWAYMNLHDNKPGGDILVPCFNSSGKFMTFHTRTVSTKVKISRINGKIRALYDVGVEGDIIESECNIDFNKEDIINEIQLSTKKAFEKRAKEMIQYIQKDLHSDFLGLGFTVRASYPDIWRSVYWDQEFPKVQIEVNYRVNMRRFGMSMGKA